MLPYFPLLMATKNGNIFLPPQKRRFLKNFFTRLQQSSCQIHLNHTGVCLWCFVKPPRGTLCVPLGVTMCGGLTQTRDVFVCTQVKPLSLKGFSCVVSTVHGALVEAPYDNMIVVIGLPHHKHVFVVGCGHYQCNALPWWVVCFPDSVSLCLVAW